MNRAVSYGTNYFLFMIELIIDRYDKCIIRVNKRLSLRLDVYYTNLLPLNRSY